MIAIPAVHRLFCCIDNLGRQMGFTSPLVNAGDLNALLPPNPNAVGNGQRH